MSDGSKSQGEGIGDKEDESTNAVIKWSTLEIREYATQLDTNPSVSSGPAVALSWSYNVSPRVMIEKYEELRPPRRKMREMRVPASEREARLLASGVSRREIEQSIKSIKEAQKKRKKAIGQMKNDTVYEKIGRRVKIKKRRTCGTAPRRILLCRHLYTFTLVLHQSSRRLVKMLSSKKSSPSASSSSMSSFSSLSVSTVSRTRSFHKTKFIFW